MRMKTEAKRQAILEAAALAFQELGFERTSMSEICARVGGSKATIYNYFASKEELFSEVMFLSTEAEFMVVHQALEASTDDVAESLQRFGERLLTFSIHRAFARSGIWRFRSRGVPNWGGWFTSAACSAARI